MMDAWRVLLVDDHPLTRHGLRTVIELIPGVTVIGETESGADAVRLAKQAEANLVFMDLNLPETSGIEATRMLRAALPETLVVAMTMRQEEATIRQAIDAGVSGYLLKSASLNEIRSALESLTPGGMYLSPAIAGVLVRSGSNGVVRGSNGEVYEHVSPREREVLTLLARGLSARHIAKELHISERTVNTHVTHVYRKLAVNNRVEAINAARRLGLVEPVA